MYRYANQPSMCAYGMYELCYCCRISKKTNRSRPLYTLSVVVGAHRIFDNEPSKKRFQISQVVVSKVFFTERPRYDLALVKLNSTIQFSDKVAPICVDRSRFPDNFTCIATGWGRTSYNGLNVTFSLSL